MKMASVGVALLVGLCLAVLNACGGDGGDEEEAILIEDAEAVALQIGDLPADFVAEGEPMHVTNEESCAAAAEEEREECIERLDSFGRRDNYQVAYDSTDPEAMLSGMYYVFSGVSVYETVTGAAQSFDYGQEQLEEVIGESEDISRVSAPTVGNESAAYVANQGVLSEDVSVPVSSYVVDFRRGNLLVRVVTDIPTALGNVDEAVELARRVDERILAVAGQISSTASPTPAV
jgi:hypothetical protein